MIEKNGIWVQFYKSCLTANYVFTVNFHFIDVHAKLTVESRLIITYFFVFINDSSTTHQQHHLSVIISH